MMKETNIQSQVTSTIAGDDGEAVAKSEQNAKKKVLEKPNEGLEKPADAIIRKTKCFRILERNAKISKTKRNFSRLYPTPQKFKKIDRLRRNEIHLKAVRTSS